MKEKTITTDISALGELLIDAIVSAGETLSICGNAGGAPSNVLACAAKLGLRTQLIAKVGDDASGRWLKGALEHAQVGTDGVLMSRNHNTTLAFVELDGQGERSFRFYRNGCADVNISADEIPFEIIRSSRLFHFGSNSMTDEPARSATMKAVLFAKDVGIPVSFDVNLRERLWRNLDLAKENILSAMESADIVKLSDSEAFFLSGLKDVEKSAVLLAQRYPAKLLCITAGRNGCVCVCNGYISRHAGYCVTTVDTTGAGDAFMGAMLYQIIRDGCSLDKIDKPSLDSYAAFANATGALSTMKKGAIPAMPEALEIIALMKAL